ncbi:MAG TPA: hypothetical protein PLK08_02640, partial [Phycisphaerae bacterium]|nr:hypothetical protein [Phycisphaerae bacterium]
MENDRKKHGFDWLTATLLAWALPGMGHVFLGRAKRGIIICVTITALFWSGIAVGGVMTIDSRYEKWWFYAQILNGASGVISWLRSEREFREIEKTPEMQQLIADTLYMRAGMGFKTEVDPADNSMTGALADRHIRENVAMTRKMRVTIPVIFIGEAVGVTQGGGILEHVLRELEVECLPGDLVDSIPVDITQLALGGRLLVRDMQIPAKITVLTSGDQPVAIVSIPKEEEVVAPEATDAAATEPELIKKKKEEEGEEAAEGDKKGAKKPDEKKP